MNKPLSERSRQLLYIAITAAIFSLLSISYKYFAADEDAQVVVQGNCALDAELPDHTCDVIDPDDLSRIQVTGIEP